MKVLVTGTGLVGTEVIENAQERNFEVLGTWHSREKDFLDCEQRQLDITDRESTYSLIEEFAPDLVVHTAAYVDIKGCEDSPETSYEINVLGSKNVADACANQNSNLIYVSSDWVFDGKSAVPYKENDVAGPINMYGKHKLEGERIVLQNPNTLSVRSSFIYGYNPIQKNFVNKVLDNFNENKEVKISENVFQNPTYAGDLADIIMELGTNFDPEEKIYHAGGLGCRSRYNFALEIAEVFELNSKLIIPVKEEKIDRGAKIPRNCCMDMDKLIEKIERKPMTPREGLKATKQKME